MSPEAKKRRQSLKIIISEAIMVLTVALTVIILALLVSGYWLNSDLKVERQGMLQVSSVPTGADILIDGESSWLQRTNTSKVLSAGEHTVTLTKDGYDTWSKTVNISEGLLYRLHYPRLFLTERTSEPYLSAPDVTYATVSPDHDRILLVNNTTKWSLVRLTDEKPEPTIVDITGLFLGAIAASDSTTDSFSSTILSSDWNRDGSRVLFKVQNGDTVEWVLLDVKTPTKSINLSREFGGDFSAVQILDNSASTLLAIQNHNLHKIDASARSMSAVLVENINSFDYFGDEIVFVAASEAPNPYFVGSLKLGDDRITELLPLSSPAQVVISKFYDDKYLTLLQGATVTIYRKDNLELQATFALDFEPAHITVGHDGEFILMSTGTHIATLDMESSSVSDWSTPGESFGWLDNDMLYAVSDGELTVYDYDGLNRRALSTGVAASLPVTITGNKWLYYFSDGSIIREWLVEH